jgi:hypothetical protein
VQVQRCWCRVQRWCRGGCGGEVVQRWCKGGADVQVLMSECRCRCRCANAHHVHMVVCMPKKCRGAEVVQRCRCRGVAEVMLQRWRRGEMVERCECRCRCRCTRWSEVVHMVCLGKCRNQRWCRGSAEVVQRWCRGGLEVVQHCAEVVVPRCWCRGSASAE